MSSGSGLAYRPRPAGEFSPSPSGPATPSPSSRTGSALQKAWLQALLVFACVLLLSTVYEVEFKWKPGERTAERELLSSAPLAELEESRPGPVLVSYSYFEKDANQLQNFEFFQAVGMGTGSTVTPPADTDFVVVINGDACTPCKALRPQLKEERSVTMPQLSAIWAAPPGLALLQRVENEGMDFAAHNVTVEWLRQIGQFGKYRYFIFLNSSVRGPFYPAYMPPGWQWTRAYTDRLVGNIKVVSSSLVCLPKLDAGGYGPKVESWAFALDPAALDILTQAGVFNLRTCKLCDDGVVVMGEYGLTNVLMSKGYNVATLMAKYPVGIDWRDERHWQCNNNVHPSRHGTYDGISMHPFETVFIKASWHVGEPHLSHYTNWYTAQAAGQDTTVGAFDEPMYRYAVQPRAQEPNNAEACFKVQ